MPVVTHVSHLEFEAKHPRGKDGRFIRVGAAVKVPGLSGNQTVQGFNADGTVRVKSTAGDIRSVDPKQVSTATPKIPNATFTEEAGAAHVASLGAARANWLKRVAQQVLENPDPNDPELPYWRGVLGGTPSAAPPKPTPKPKPQAGTPDWAKPQAAQNVDVPTVQVTEEQVDAKVEQMGWYSGSLRDKYRQSVQLANPYGGTPEKPKRVTLDGQTFEVWTDPQAAAEGVANQAQGYDWATRLRYPDGHVESLEQDHDVEFAIADELGRTLARRALESQASPLADIIGTKPAVPAATPQQLEVVPKLVAGLGEPTSIEPSPLGGGARRLTYDHSVKLGGASGKWIDVTGDGKVIVHQGGVLGATTVASPATIDHVLPNAPKPAPNPNPEPAFKPKQLADLKDARAYYEELRARIAANYPLDDLDPHRRDNVTVAGARSAEEVFGPQPKSLDDVVIFTTPDMAHGHQGLSVDFNGERYATGRLKTTMTGYEYYLKRRSDAREVGPVIIDNVTSTDQTTQALRKLTQQLIDEPPVVVAEAKPTYDVKSIHVGEQDPQSRPGWRTVLSGDQRIGAIHRTYTEAGKPVWELRIADDNSNWYLGVSPNSSEETAAPKLIQQLNGTRQNAPVQYTGGDLPEGHQIGHARELLFDMARGRDRVPHVTAVSNEDYRKKLEAEGKLPDLQEFVNEQPWRIKRRTYGFSEFGHDPAVRRFGKGYLSKVEVTLPPDSSETTITKARALLSTGLGAKERAYLQAHPDATFVDVVKHSDVVAYKSDISYLRQEREDQAKRKYDARVNTLINRERKKDGTSSVEFKDIPHWSSVTLADQTWDDVREHMRQAAQGSFVPTFHESGLVEDGVLYHRGARESTPPPHDAALRAARIGFWDKLSEQPDSSYDTYMDGELTPRSDLFEVLQSAEDPHELQDLAGMITTKYKYSNINDIPFQPLKDWDAHQYFAPTGGQDSVTTSKVRVDADQQAVDVLTRAGAVAAVNSKNIDPGYRGRGKIYAGRMLILTEGEKPETELDALIRAKRQLKAQLKQFASNSNLPPTFDFSEFDSAPDWESLQRTMPKFKLWLFDNGQNTLSIAKPVQEFYDQAGERSVPRIRATKRIEYVPHDQGWDIHAPTEQERTDAFRNAALATFSESLSGYGQPLDTLVNGLGAVHAAQTPAEVQEALTKLTSATGDATDLYYARSRAVTAGQGALNKLPSRVTANRKGSPTSQRGRLTVEGYSPEEATAKLRELGIVGELDSAVPFTQVMRSNRREGLVLPLHRDYINGDAPLPKIHHLLTHGITGGGWKKGDQEKVERSIFGGGGLHSIAERFKRGIKVNTTSPAGDIRSGIDHVVFVAHDSGSAVGGGAAIRIGLKPEAFLRRTIAMAPRDFGGMDTRYDEYKRYLNSLQTRAKEPLTNIYASPSPKVRQYHINSKRSNPGSAEYDIGGSIPVEDMAVVAVQTQEAAQSLNTLLDDMLAQGKIASRPRVVVGSSEFKDAITVE